VLDGPGPGHGLELWQRQAQAGVGQDKVVANMEERQLLTQARFVFAQRGDPSTDRRHMLTKVQIQACDEGRIDLPAPLGQEGLGGLCCAEADAVRDPDEAPAPIALVG
jgi:hypothetical protein